MAKSDIYYLIDPYGLVVAKFEQDDDFMSGKCYKCTSWVENDNTGNYDIPYDWDFVAKAYCKWDGCTHWYFYGEDYDVEANEKPDGYYHICGADCFANHIKYMCFIWKLAPMIISEHMDDMEYIYDEYYGKDEIRFLVNTMLKGYTIKKGEETSDGKVY